MGLLWFLPSPVHVRVVHGFVGKGSLVILKLSPVLPPVVGPLPAERIGHSPPLSKIPTRGPAPRVKLFAPVVLVPIWPLSSSPSPQIWRALVPSLVGRGIPSKEARG